MFDEVLVSWSAWWDTVPTGFAFLLALAFFVAAAGLLRDGGRHRSDQPRGAEDRPVGCADP